MIRLSLRPGRPVFLPVYFLAALLNGFNGSAQNIGSWNFNNTIAGVAAANNTVSTADFAPSIATRAFNGSTEYYGQGSWPTGGINTSSYLQFTLTPKAGHVLNILSITLRMRRSNTGSPAGSGPTAWSVRSSRDGYATNIASGSMNLNYANYTIFPGSTFGSVPVAVSFRVYGYTATTSSGGQSRMVFDNVAVAGFGNILPVQLVSFTAKANARQVDLQYHLMNTEPGTAYVLERGTDGINFNAIHTTAESGMQESADYAYSDRTAPAGTSRIYYRLRIEESSGPIIYSPIVVVNLGNVSPGILANISGNSLTLLGVIPGNAVIALFNNAGNCVFSERSGAATTAASRITLPNLVRGVYHVSIITSSGRQTISVMAQ